MNKIQSVPVRFDIKILENDGIELAKLLPQLAEHKEKIQEYIGSVYQEDPSFSQESNKKIFGLFNTSLLELMKITLVSTLKRFNIVFAYNTFLIQMTWPYRMLTSESQINRSAIKREKRPLPFSKG